MWESQQPPFFLAGPRNLSSKSHLQKFSFCEYCQTADPQSWTSGVAAILLTFGNPQWATIAFFSSVTVGNTQWSASDFNLFPDVIRSFGYAILSSVHYLEDFRYLLPVWKPAIMPVWWCWRHQTNSSIFLYTGREGEKHGKKASISTLLISKRDFHKQSITCSG